MTTKTTYPKIPCEFDVSGPGAFRSRNCGKPSVSLVARWRTDRLEGRCKQHASVDARRKYSPLEPIEITPEREAEILARFAELREAREAERKVKNEQHEAAVRYHKKQAAAEALVVWEARRQDDDAPYGETQQIPTWHLAPVGVELPPYGAEQQVQVKRADGFPVSIRVRNANTLTLSQAAALMHALQLALEEAGVKVTE